MPETPEQKARHSIDANLAAAGWLVQERDELDLTAGRETRGSYLSNVRTLTTSGFKRTIFSFRAETDQNIW